MSKEGVYIAIELIQFNEKRKENNVDTIVFIVYKKVFRTRLQVNRGTRRNG